MAAAHDPKPKPDPKPDHGPQVQVLYRNTNERAKFPAAWDTTVADVWSKAYAELGEERKDIDTFETEDGTDLGPYLNLTLEQLREQKISPERHFAIRSETGGA